MAKGNPSCLDTIVHKADVLAEATLVIAYAVYPGLSAKIFATFNCGQVSYADVNEEFLLADHDIDCNDPVHKAAETFAGICVACICIGTPVLYFMLLWRSHNAMQSGAHSARHLRFLEADYRPECWYWESVETSRSGARMTAASLGVSG